MEEQLNIYNNGENKILFASGDKIIRQPYELGFGYKNALSTNHYINITGLSLSDIYSYVCIRDCRDAGTGTNPSFSLISSSLSRSDANNDRNNGFMILNTMESTGLAQPSGIANYRVTCRNYDNGITSYINNNNNPLTVNQQPGVGGIKDRLTIGAGSNYGTNSGSVSKGFGTVFHRFMIFNRLMLRNEIQWLYRNGNFSALQVSDGLIHDWNFRQGFELITFDSIENRVCVRDQIGGRHGVVQQLPAGTPAEQLEYAKSNLYFRFIT
jgi:hypothetical protein